MSTAPVTLAPAPAASRERIGVSRVLRAKAPLRVSFAGGGTDIDPFRMEEGGLVLSATIALHAYGCLAPRADAKIHIHSADLDLDLTIDSKGPIELDGDLGLVKAAIRRLSRAEDGGYDLHLHCDAPPGSGLGSSSTLMVTLVGLLRDHHGLALTDYEVAALAHELERNDLGIAGGMQDQYAATFGGFNFLEFRGDGVVVNPLRVKRETLWELEHNLLLCYTGVTRASNQIIEDQTRRVTAGTGGTRQALRAQKDLAIAMKDALLRNELDEFGRLLDAAWQQKKRMSPKISTGHIDEAYNVARKAGALGGKVTGAGGGGHIIFYCDFVRRHRVQAALNRIGYSASPLHFEGHGLATWRAPETS